MSQKRRDKKGRVLQTGESQRADGRYRYKYKDKEGNEKNVYSWRLVETDRLPSGVRDCVALRTMKKQIEANLKEGLASGGESITVLQLCERYIRSKEPTVKKNSRAAYVSIMNNLKQEPFAKTKIKEVSFNDAKDFLQKLQRDGKGYSSIQHMRGVLRPAFAEALRNEWIRYNPFNFPMSEAIKKTVKKRSAVTTDDKDRFLSFVSDNRHYKLYAEQFTILFETGLRCGEFCALTMEDIHLDEEVPYLSVRKSLQKTREKNPRIYIEESGKTINAVRDIPLTPKAVEAFKRAFEKRPSVRNEPVVDGYSGFVFLNTFNGICRPLVPYDVEHHLKRAINRYNDTHEEQIPMFVPHECRHTYCTEMISSNAFDIKSVQYFMGHALAETTLDTYAHSSKEVAFRQFQQMNGK